MVKNRKSLTAILVSLLLLLALTVSLTPIISNAAATEVSETVEFDFDIPEGQQIKRTKNYEKRNTTSVKNAWAVKLDYSDEPTLAHPYGGGNTKTTFWLGIYNPNGINPLGSKKYNVSEGKDKFDYLTALAKASNKNVYLYACDNDNRSISYSVSGRWNPATGRKPLR